jgi:two-component system, OmpR family, sensor kinase
MPTLARVVDCRDAMTRGLFLRAVIAFWISVVLSIVIIKLFLKEPGESDAAFVWALISRLLIFLVVSAAVMLLATRSVTRPVHWLRSAVEKLGSGDLGARVGGEAAETKPTAEMAALIRDFNQMAERVEELVRSQRQLIVNVSHELRSPLARLSLVGDLLRRFPEDRDEHLARFENEVGKLNQLIESLLTLSRLESSPALLKEDFFDLSDLTDRIISDVQFEASARGCSVAATRSEHCPILGDPLLIGSAIENIMRNAILYSDEGTTVCVEVRCDETEAMMMVTDKGPGLSDNELSQIFQPFFRGVEARSRRSDGHSLGLAIALRAIDLHRGTIGAQNTESGLVVSIRLPLATQVKAHDQRRP